MKKFFSIVMSVSLMLSLFAGLDFSAYALSVTGIEYRANTPLVTYEGWHTEERSEWDDDKNTNNIYTYYRLERWDVLFVEGNEITLTYSDGSDKSFVCKEEYIEDEDRYETEFFAEDGSYIDFDDVNCEEDENDIQSAKNQWQVGETHTFTVSYNGKKSATPTEIKILENPVEWVDMDIDGSITLMENRHGEDDRDDDNNPYFRYWESGNYLKALHPTFTVKYKDADKPVVYDYSDFEDEIWHDWVPHDSEGNTVDDMYFELDFRQWENHYTVESVNNEAYISYYGFENPITVKVVPYTDVNDGALTINERKNILFYGGEEHTLTVKPEADGLFNFYGEALWAVHDGNGEAELTDGYGNVMENLSDPGDIDNLRYLLKGGTTYTLKLKRQDSCDDIRYTDINCEQRLSVSDISFTPTEPLEVTEGEYLTDELIFHEGNTAEITLSNGDKYSFTCNDRGEFVNEEGMRIYELAERLDVEGGTYLHGEASSVPWNKDDANPTLRVYSGDFTYAELAVTVAETAVESIEYITDENPRELIYGVDSEKWDENEPYARFDRRSPARSGDRIRVTYNDSRGAQEYYYRGWNDFVNTEDEGDVIHPHFSTNEDDGEWTVGNSYTFGVDYQYASSSIPVRIVETDVESISFTPFKPIVVYVGEEYGREETKRYWDEDAKEEVAETFFRYYTPDFYNYGNLLTVNYKDGRETTFKCVNTRESEHDEDRWEYVDINNSDNALDGLHFFWYDNQWDNHWTIGTDNVMYISYKGVDCTVPVEVSNAAYECYLNAVSFGSNAVIENGTLYIEPNSEVFIGFDTDFDRNMDNGVAPFIGFNDGWHSDGYVGPLTAEGFGCDEGDAYFYGFDSDLYGVRIRTKNLAIGTSASLDYNLYELPDDFNREDGFDFVNTPKVLEKTLRVVVSDHIWEETSRVPATCTSPGSVTKLCRLCGKTDSEPLAQLSHSFGNNSQYCVYGCGTVNPNYVAPAPIPAPVPTAPAPTVPAAVTAKVKAAKKSVTVSWNSLDGATGYEIQYSTNKKFKKAKTKKVKAAKKKLTIKKLTSKKTYYVRVRAVNGADAGAWSKAKKVKVK